MLQQHTEPVSESTDDVNSCIGSCQAQLKLSNFTGKSLLFSGIDVCVSIMKNVWAKQAACFVRKFMMVRHSSWQESKVLKQSDVYNLYIIIHLYIIICYVNCNVASGPSLFLISNKSYSYGSCLIDFVL